MRGEHAVVGNEIIYIYKMERQKIHSLIEKLPKACLGQAVKATGTGVRRAEPLEALRLWLRFSPV